MSPDMVHPMLLLLLKWRLPMEHKVCCQSRTENCHTLKEWLHTCCVLQ